MIGLAGVAGLASVWWRSALPIWLTTAFCWTVLAASSTLETRLRASDDGRDWQVSGWVDAIPMTQPGRSVFSLRVDLGHVELGGQRLRLSWYDPPAPIAPGARLELTVRLRHPRGLLNPGGFDYERWLFLERYAATGYVRDSHAEPTQHVAPAAGLLRLRWRLAERIREQVDHREAAAVMTALTLGERSELSEDLWDVLRRTGTSHLIAISGLHISLISGLCLLAASALARRLPATAAWDLEIAVTAAIIVGGAYAALAGFALPTRRASIMVAFAALVILSRRRIGSLNGLAIAAISVLALDPLATLSASFWMSFAAVGVLLVCHVPRQLALAPMRRLRIRRAVSLQCRLTLALMPLTAAFFGGVSLLAVPVNLIAIPLFCLALIPASLLAVVAFALVPALTVPVELVGLACGLVVAALTRAAQLPGALIEVQPVGPLALVLAVVAVAFALPWHRSRGRVVLWAGLLPLFFPRTPTIAHGQLDVALLDVGHGLAIVLTTREHRMVYDAGPLFRSGFNAGAEIVVPALARDAGRGLDRILLSHGDSDHSGGALALLRAYPDSELVTGPDVDFDGVRRCLAGERWQWDGVVFEILHPTPDFAARGNDSSCVLRVETATQSMLITGDIEARGEQALLRHAGLDVDVLVVPHHGSATSSSAALVARTTPALALVSAAFGNQWGFPVPEVRQRWQAAGAELYITGESGAIRLRLGGAAPVLALERELKRRYWHAR